MNPMIKNYDWHSFGETLYTLSTAIVIISLAILQHNIRFYIAAGFISLFLGLQIFCKDKGEEYRKSQIDGMIGVSK